VDYAVVVVGGGPAGALAALKLAREGVSVLVIDRERPERVEAAEILSPEGRAILEREKIWDNIPLNLTWPCPAMAAAWAEPELAWTTFGGDAPEPAWHLDRIAFDAWMIQRLRASSIDVQRGTVHAVNRDRDGWILRCTGDAAQRSVSARCLILATGRSPRAVRVAPRRRIDSLCLVCGTSDPDPVDPDVLIVEATADGWWYSAPLVSGRLFTGWMTDFSLIGHTHYEAAAMRSLEGAPVHAKRIGRPRLSKVVGSATWAMSPAAGPGWLAIGDAALARDPISGDGLTSALRSACEGADAMLRGLNGDEAVWASEVARLAQNAARYQERRLDLYRVAAKRWPSSPFWNGR
jgi:flavin-dependent dehydrogenase